MPAVSSAAEESTNLSSVANGETAGEALIVKGTPAALNQPGSGKTKVLWCLGIVLGLSVVMVVTKLKLLRPAGNAGGLGADEENLKMPRDMGFKEPLDAPQ